MKPNCISRHRIMRFASNHSLTILSAKEICEFGKLFAKIILSQFSENFLISHMPKKSAKICIIRFIRVLFRVTLCVLCAYARESKHEIASSLRFPQ